jgi:hypothetical protein
MDNWKVPAMVAGGAFVLSFLIGLFSGALFGIILLRAVIFGMLGGVLALAIPFVADRYLPDIQDDEEPVPGGSVDIVLDQENPHLAAGGDFIQEVVEGPSETTDSPGGVDSLPDDEGVSELEAVGDEDEAGSPKPDLPTEVVEPSQEPAPSPMGGLPTLDAFEDSFSVQLTAEDGGGGADLGGGFAETVNVDGADHDPREIAKAVQTILKRDQEG